MKNDLHLPEGLIAPGSLVVAAVSGGADSVCLLDLLRRQDDIRVVCAHFEHGIRGEESRRDAEFVQDLCAGWGVEFVLGHGSVPAYAGEHGLGLEEAARLMRYDFLERTADRLGAEYIATAHNMNDCAETVLLNMTRGTGLKGLSGIPPRRGRVIRPLLGVSRTEIEEYLSEQGIPHVEDSTNAEDDYARNRIRHHVLPVLEEIRPGTTRRIARMASSVRRDEEFLQGLAEEFLSDQGQGSVSVSALTALPEPVAARVLRTLSGGALSEERTRAALMFCRGDSASGTVQYTGGCFKRSYDRLWAETEDQSTLPSAILIRELPEEGIVGLPEAGLEIEIRRSADPAEIQSSFNTFSFSCGRLCGKINVTPRAEGDRISFPGREGTRSLKKLMADRKIPRERRDLIPVLRDGRGVAAVYGFGQEAALLPQSGEQFIRITIRETGV